MLVLTLKNVLCCKRSAIEAFLIGRDSHCDLRLIMFYFRECVTSVISGIIRHFSTDKPLVVFFS